MDNFTFQYAHISSFFISANIRKYLANIIELYVKNMPYLYSVKRLIFGGMNNKPITLIASDMNGTLLDLKGILNPEFFTAFEDLSSEDIMFAAASDRQYYNLLKLFTLIKDKVIFIAENRTYVLFNSQELPIVDVLIEKAREVIREVRGIEGAYPVLCGKNKVYIEDCHPDFVKQAYTYYGKCDIVPDLMNVTDDRFLKIAVYDFRGSAINSYPVFLKL
ncbi:HAD hydrolase family protein [Prevotella cerevisiae]|uniref:HAD hydrolase family protein n=1 Tax=Segatella cerevisiae TaxID=2053716 RepID=A0ABT1BTW6_9BACT|nr:HAD hydrolase family protein [Segatella cerevisiae]MCO6024525.1 HAD hydrolase family protein [Segatella cerevisiae]